MIEKVRQYIAQERLLEKGDRVVLGLSGGADSICLLLLLQEMGYDVLAAHCNFQLRGEESERDERFVRALCAERKIKLRVMRFDTTGHANEHGQSIEMAARQLRYDFFHELTEEENCQKICIAHHSDDHIETLFINLLRGTGLKGLCGIQPRNGKVVRPLLCCTREEITTFLDKQGQDYVTDSSNLEHDFLRNRIRLELLPLMEEISPSARKNILTTMENLNATECAYEEALATYMEDFTYKRDDILYIHKDRLRESASPVAVLHSLLSPLGFNRSQLFQIVNTLDHVGKVFESHANRLLIDREWLLAEEKSDNGFQAVAIGLSSATEGCVEIGSGKSICWRIVDAGSCPIQRSGGYAYLDLLKIQGPLWIRQVRESDSFQPYGMGGRRKKLSDFLTDLKMNRFEKERQIVVECLDEIAWVVGLRGSERFKVTADTRQAVELRLVSVSQ